MGARLVGHERLGVGLASLTTGCLTGGSRSRRSSERLHQVAPRIDENAGIVGRDRRRSALDLARNPRSGTTAGISEGQCSIQSTTYAVGGYERPAGSNRALSSTAPKRSDNHPPAITPSIGRLASGPSMLSQRFDSAGAGLPALTEPSVSPVIGLYVMAGHLQTSTLAGGRRSRELTGRAAIWNSSRPPSCRKSGESRRATCHGSRWGRQTDGSPDPARSDMWAATTSP
jgi:hypothetical protein